MHHSIVHLLSLFTNIMKKSTYDIPAQLVERPHQSPRYEHAERKGAGKLGPMVQKPIHNTNGPKECGVERY